MFVELGESQLKFTMTVYDPTIALLNKLEISPTESIVGALFLLLGFLCNILNLDRGLKNKSHYISSEIVRTPESAFKKVETPFRARYFTARYSDSVIPGKTFRVHYLDEGDPYSREVILCLHGLPFW